MPMHPPCALPVPAGAPPSGNGRWLALQQALQGRPSPAARHMATQGLQRLAQMPPLLWLALQAAALWPHGRWAAARLGDGSDDPLGLAALAAFAVLLFRWGPQLRHAPRSPWLAASAGLTLGAAFAHLLLPPLPAAVLAALALGATLAAWLPVHAPRSPLAGLLLLALPLVASLQFYAGYPLRVVTAAASAALLRGGGLEAVRSGVTLEVGGRLVIVDAPCSGVQLAWLGYFTACAVAAWLGLREGSFWRRLPLVGAMVLTVNVLRNAVLVALEARPAGLDPAVHEAIGLAAVALAVLGIAAWMGRDEGRAAEPRLPDLSVPSRARVGTLGATTRSLAAWSAALVLAAALPLWPAGATAASARAASSVDSGAEWPEEWPAELDGRRLRPLALTPVEARFAAQFPGRIGRFDGGDAVWVLRDVHSPTRMLHPATDCYRGLGYRITHTALEADAQGRRWRCFLAERDGRRVRVCERIESLDGRPGPQFTDTSAWYWAAALGQTRGPWRALTRVETP